MAKKQFIGDFILQNSVFVKPQVVGDANNSSVSVLYEVFKVVNGKPLFLKEHYIRLKESFEKTFGGYTFPIALDTLQAQVYDISQKNEIFNSNIELSLIGDSCGECFYTMGFILSKYPTTDMYNEGVATALLHDERVNPNVKAKGLKVRDKANDIIANKNVFEVLLVNKNGILTEGSRSNLFVVKGNVLHTATDEKVLKGVTRKYVVDIINKLGYTIDKQLKYTDLSDVDGAFITGTSIGVLPINSIDNIKLNANNHIIEKLIVEFRKLEKACI